MIRPSLTGKPDLSGSEHLKKSQEHGMKPWGIAAPRTSGDRLGWRLPAIEELASLVDPTQTHAPFLPTGHPFNNVLIGGQIYYSATTIASNPPNAMGMRPYDGSIRATLKNVRDIFVWCVRGGYGPGADGQ